MMTVKTNDLLGIVGGILGIAGFAYGYHAHQESKKALRRINQTIDDLADDVEVKVPDGLVDAAVEEAVDREVGKAVRKATDSVIASTKNDIHNQVSKAVKDEMGSITESVDAKADELVKNMDITELKKTVVRKAEEKVEAKFENELDDTLEKFNAKLDSVAKIYSSIADTIQNANQPSSKGTTFTIN